MAVNAGARLDRLPLSAFHRRIMWLIGIGMFFDGFDIYVASTVLGATVSTKFATLAQVPHFVAATFLGMTIGSFGTGFLGDKFGRRFTYQANLMVFGLASLASAFAPNMEFLIVCRFVMGVGLGAENVVGYSTLTEFVPPKARGKLQGIMAVFVVTGLPVSALAGALLGWLASQGTIAPAMIWRSMFVLGGLGSIAVWWARKKLPESPRWLAATGRDQEAETLLQSIEAEVAAETGPLPQPSTAPSRVFSRAFGSMFSPELLPRVLVGCFLLIVINTLLYGFVTWLPTFFIKQGMTIAKSLNFTLVMALGAPIGSGIGALTADHWGRKNTIITSSLAAIVFGAIYPFMHAPAMVMLVGFLLTVPIYVLVALLFGIYVPELFPTEIRLRASGLCNTFGRGATIATPYAVVALLNNYGVTGVMGLMISLLVLQIVAVAAWGIEPKGRGLEDVASGEPRKIPISTSVSAS